MFLSGTGFKSTNHRNIARVRRSLNILVYKKMKLQIKAGSELIWLWVVIEPKDKEILAINISKERNMFVVERFLSNVIKEYGKHPVSTDGGTWHPPQACRFLKLAYPSSFFCIQE
jgi:putative transposase